MAKEVVSVLPYNLEAEQSLLASMLIDQELQYEIQSSLHVEDFYVESHKLIFEGIKSVLEGNVPVDVVTLTDTMAKTPVVDKAKRRRLDINTLAQELEKMTTLEKVGGVEYLAQLTNVIPSAINYKYYLDIVLRDSTLRKLIRSAELIIKDAKVSSDSKQSLSSAEKLIYDISAEQETSSLTNVKENLEEVIEDLSKPFEEKKNGRGLLSGFPALDKMSSGFKKGNLIILAARPSVGKTTLAMNFVENIALRSNAVCAVFALEMTKEELAERMLYSVAGVSSIKAKANKLEQGDWKKVWNAKKQIDGAEIYIDDTSITSVPDIMSKCRRLKSLRGKLDLIVVDHIQLMNAVKQSDSRQSEITEISRGLKMIAKELEVPVIALSQLNRSVEKVGRKPILSDLRESGAIEQDADIVMFIHRPEIAGNSTKRETEEPVKKDEAEVIIAKNRSGQIGSFYVQFKGEYSKFVQIDMHAVEPHFDYEENYASNNQMQKIKVDDEAVAGMTIPDDDPVYMDSADDYISEEDE